MVLGAAVTDASEEEEEDLFVFSGKIPPHAAAVIPTSYIKLSHTYSAVRRCCPPPGWWT